MMIDRRRSVGMPARCAGYVPEWVRLRTHCDDSAIMQTVSGIRIVETQGKIRDISAPGYILDRTRFDKNLAIHAIEAGADLAQAMVLRREGRLLFGRRNGHEAVFSADYILGADGPSSVIGRSVGLSNRQFWATLQYEVGLKTPDVWFEIYPLLEHAGVSWFVPCGQTARIGIGMPRGQARFFKLRLHTFFQQLVSDGRVYNGILGCSGGLMPVNGPLQTLHADRILLAGDAGGIAEPFSGAGIASAIICGELAGDVLGAACQNHCPALLNDYDVTLAGWLPMIQTPHMFERVSQMAAWSPRVLT
jgi:flavin-dependent dehydrogenase